MAEYDNTNSGAMFFEDDKQSDRHPDYKGSINVDGKDYWLSAWDKVSKSGKNYISISIKLKEPRAEGKNSDAWKAVEAKFKKPVENTPDEFDEPLDISSIPF